MTVFSVQDETGTVYQLTTLASPSATVSVGDQGTYVGTPDDGTDGFVVPAEVTDAFQVSQVLDAEHFSITTLIQSGSNWPRSGVVTWLTGANALLTSTIVEIDPANAYINVAFLDKYCASRNISIPTSTEGGKQGAIVAATDYLDQKYRFRGIKLVQRVGQDFSDANAVFLEPWLTPYALNGLAILTPSTTPQHTEWPRQGVVDNNGDSINGLPLTLKMACAELSVRALSGIKLQPDFDPNLGGQGGLVSSLTKKVGPLETIVAYDTKAGFGFFASFPQVDRMLSKAGLLVSNGGRSVMR
jgi:hypothetical protein